MERQMSEDVILDVDPSTLLPNPYQTRLMSDGSDPSLGELAESIRRMGLIELPIVRETKKGLEISAGHRRVDACKTLGFKSIKCILRPLTDQQMAEVNLDENLKRKTLNPIEEARGYANFRDHFKRSEEWIATRFGVTRDIVAQRLRLLTFQQPIQDFVAKGLLTVSHAEAISMAPANKQVQLAQNAIQEKLTVKMTTEMAKESLEVEKANKEALENIAARNRTMDARLDVLEKNVASHESLLVWHEFHAHPWKSKDCRYNINGFCKRFCWKSKPEWVRRLRGTAKFSRSGDRVWHVEACDAVCAHCDVYEARVKS